MKDTRGLPDDPPLAGVAKDEAADEVAGAFPTADVAVCVEGVPENCSDGSVSDSLRVEDAEKDEDKLPADLLLISLLALPRSKSFL